MTKGRPDMTHGSAMTLDIACERIEQLAFQIMQAIQPELARHPTHPNPLPPDPIPRLNARPLGSEMKPKVSGQATAPRRSRGRPLGLMSGCGGELDVVAEGFEVVIRRRLAASGLSRRVK